MINSFNWLQSQIKLIWCVLRKIEENGSTGGGGDLQTVLQAGATADLPNTRVDINTSNLKVTAGGQIDVSGGADVTVNSDGSIKLSQSSFIDMNNSAKLKITNGSGINASNSVMLGGGPATNFDPDSENPEGIDWGYDSAIFLAGGNLPNPYNYVKVNRGGKLNLANGANIDAQASYVYMRDGARISMGDPNYSGIHIDVYANNLTLGDAEIKLKSNSKSIELTAEGLKVNPYSGGYTLPVVKGVEGQTLVTNAAGVVSWKDAIPEPPATGTHTLQSVDGVMSWIVVTP